MYVVSSVFEFKVEKKMSKKDYLEGLTADVKARYYDKIKIVDNIDPYSITRENFNVDVTNFPSAHFIDIVSYFIFTHSFYTSQQLKAYKSLEAFKYYESGFVQKLMCKKVKENFIVLGEVKYSQRMSEKSLQPWLIILSDGSISSAHCTCMAGLGEVCSHVAAVAFALHFRNNPDEETSSCTDKLAAWPVPAVSKNVVPKKVSEIDWGKKIKCTDRQLENMPSLDGPSLKSFLEKLQEADPSAAILSVVQPHAAKKVIPNVEYNLPMILTDFYEEGFETFSLDDLRKVEIDLSVTDEEKLNVERLTMLQNKSSHWYKYRAGRITASNFKKICRTSVQKPSLSLLKAVCYPQKQLFKTDAVSYGLEHEEDARKEYEREIGHKHANFLMKNAGFTVSTETPAVGASPDGLIFCDCCGMGCIEIKCPYRLKDPTVDLAKFTSMQNSFLLSDDGKFYLDRNHDYYYQVQLQMYVTQTTFCDFIIWSRRYLHVERIYYDDTFLRRNLEKALLFHQNVIIPELLAQWYTQSKNEVQEELWCDCREIDNGREMLRCTNEDCPIKWFHVECMNLYNLPTVFWFCRTCSAKFFGNH